MTSINHRPTKAELFAGEKAPMSISEAVWLKFMTDEGKKPNYLEKAVEKRVFWLAKVATGAVLEGGLRILDAAVSSLSVLNSSKENNTVNPGIPGQETMEQMQLMDANLSGE